jgi:glycosyl transferase family 87
VNTPIDTIPKTPRWLTKWVLVILMSLAGLGVNAYLKWPVLHYIIRGDNDFIGFYAFAEMAGSADLYNADAVLRTETPLCEIPRFLPYVRLPFYAALLSPLRWWPYHHAYWVWQCLCLLALLGFIYFWPGPRWVAILACCWSVPLFDCFIVGRDVMLVMLALSAAAWLLWREKHFAAGCILSLCLIKYNLFFPLPLLILGKRMWRLGTGFAAGAALLVAISFLTGGWNWPLRYIAALRLKATTPESGGLPNLHGLFAMQPDSLLWQAGGTVVVLLATWFVIRHADIAQALAITLISGLLLSYHAFFGDAFILAPAALLLISAPAAELDIPIGVFLLSPIAYLPFLLPKTPLPPSATVVAMLMLITASVVWKNFRLPVLKSAN